MLKDNFNDLLSFMVVARERSFTRAAAQLGVSQSALSHAMRKLEARLDVRLLTRTTRSVVPTLAGEQLFTRLSPHLLEIEQELTALRSARDKPAGAIRIVAGEHAMDAVLWPVLKAFMVQYPEINVEVTVDNGLTDIVDGRFDAGVRLGEQVAKDMIAVRIAPDMRMAVVGSRDYLARFGVPQTPEQLYQHRILTHTSRTNRFAWPLQHGNKTMPWPDHAVLRSNDGQVLLQAAIAGNGILMQPDFLVAEALAKGELVTIMDACAPAPKPVQMVYPRSKKALPKLNAFVTFIVERLQPA